MAAKGVRFGGDRARAGNTAHSNSKTLALSPQRRQRDRAMFCARAGRRDPSCALISPPWSQCCWCWCCSCCARTPQAAQSLRTDTTQERRLDEPALTLGRRAQHGGSGSDGCVSGAVCASPCPLAAVQPAGTSPQLAGGPSKVGGGRGKLVSTADLITDSTVQDTDRDTSGPAGTERVRTWMGMLQQCKGEHGPRGANQTLASILMVHA